MIAIIGKMGVGKTKFINSLNKKYKIFISDDFITQIYKKNEIGYFLIKKNIGSFVLNESGVDKAKLFLWLKKDKKHWILLEKLIYPILKKELENGDYDFVEIPKLKSENFDFSSLFSLILCLSTTAEKHKKNLKKRNVDNSKINAINEKNAPKSIINALFTKIPIVDIYGNKLWKYAKNKKFLQFLFSIS